MKVEMKLEGLGGVIELLQSLPAELVSKNGGPVKSALRKGAKVIHTQAVANLSAVTANKTDEDEQTSTGLLKQNVVVTRGKAPMDGKGERYLVRVRNKSYPGRDGKRVTTQMNAARLEYGTSKQPPEPWLRPAFLSKAELAIKTAEKELGAGLDRAVKKLASQTKGRK